MKMCETDKNTKKTIAPGSERGFGKDGSKEVKSVWREEENGDKHRRSQGQ